MGKHNRSTSRRIVSRVALAGGTAAAAGVMTLAGAGTASAASLHLFGVGHHAQKHAEHHLGITGSPGTPQASGTQSQTTGNGSHTTGAATHQAAKAHVSAEHHVGKAGSTTH